MGPRARRNQWLAAFDAADAVSGPGSVPARGRRRLTESALYVSCLNAPLCGQRVASTVLIRVLLVSLLIVLVVLLVELPAEGLNSQRSTYWGASFAAPTPGPCAPIVTPRPSQTHAPPLWSVAKPRSSRLCALLSIVTGALATNLHKRRTTLRTRIPYEWHGIELRSVTQ